MIDLLKLIDTASALMEMYTVISAALVLIRVRDHNYLYQQIAISRKDGGRGERREKSKTPQWHFPPTHSHTHPIHNTKHGDTTQRTLGWLKSQEPPQSGINIRSVRTYIVIPTAKQ